MVRRNALILAVLLIGVQSAVFSATKAPSRALQKLQSLTGDWVGKDDRGLPLKTTFGSIAGETAVMETLTAHGMENMVTIYSQDGDSVVLLHYCPTNNQPRMRAMPPQGDFKELVFTFEGAGNLSSVTEGHEHKLVIQFHDPNHITERWTWRAGDKDTETIYNFERKASK